MSYDLAVWTTREPQLREALPDPDEWTALPDGYSRERRGWQLVVSGPLRVAAEDVPDEVAAQLPGIAFLTELSVEPISAPMSARQLAVTTARRIGKGAHGVVVDPQEDTVTAPSGVKRFVAARRPDRFSVIDMRWWFTESPLLDGDGIDRFLRLLRTRLPEAMPKRYGLYEPPQHRFDEEGFDHFREFLTEHAAEIVVWYPTRPVVAVSISPEPDWGVGRLGFRCGYATISVERAALSQPGWQAGLRDVWMEASQILTPFYGEVRTLGGLIRSGGTYAVDMDTEDSPVRGPFWRGIPRDPGHACVCGPAYLGLWPGLAARAEHRGGLGFVTTGDWLSTESVLDQVGAVPDAIAQRHTPSWTRDPRHGGRFKRWNTEYPPNWPFGDRPPPDSR